MIQILFGLAGFAAGVLTDRLIKRKAKPSSNKSEDVQCLMETCEGVGPCPHCGQQIDLKETYCSACGEALQ